MSLMNASILKQKQLKSCTTDKFFKSLIKCSITELSHVPKLTDLYQKSIVYLHYLLKL